jgi:hypothetical protein
MLQCIYMRHYRESARRIPCAWPHCPSAKRLQSHGSTDKRNKRYLEFLLNVLNGFGGGAVLWLVECFPRGRFANSQDLKDIWQGKFVEGEIPST